MHWDKLFGILLSICTYGHGGVVRSRRARDTLCDIEGGTCVKAESCIGWVDATFDLGCGNNVCCKPAPSTLNPEPAYPNNDTCGIITRVERKNPLLRIVGGDPALEGEWPWQVVFLDNAGDAFCGGTLITPEFVLTAAHCFVSYTEANTEIVLGEHHLMHHTGNEVRRRAKTIVKHGYYIAGVHAYDIAFVQLDSPVDVSGHYVRTACFGSQREWTWDANDVCYSSGWGYTKDVSQDGFRLNHVRMDIVNNSYCASAWDGYANVTSDMICGGDGVTGTCQGDSGGPLVCYRNGQYHLVGVTSFGYFTCTQTGYPDVFTRVTPYLDWMTDYMMLLQTVS